MFLTFDLNIIEGCNLNCLYCFEPKIKINKITSDTLYQFTSKIDQILSSKWFKRKFKGSPFPIFDGIQINFWGGEPSLHPNAISYLLEKYKDNNAISFLIYTNGVFFMNKFKETLIKYNNLKSYGNINKFSLQFSYDGFKATNLYRKHNNINEISNHILQNIDWCSKNNIPFNIKSTLSPQALYLLYESYLDIKNIIKKYNLNSKYFPTIDYLNDYSFNDETSEKYNKILEEQMNLICIDEYDEIKNNSRSYFKWLENKRTNCNSGNTLYGININGDVFNCHGEFYQNKKHISSIYDELFTNFISENIFNTWDLSKKESHECSICNVRFCQRCPIKTFQNSTKISHIEKWTDYSNRKYICQWFNIIDNVKRKFNF